MKAQNDFRTVCFAGVDVGFGQALFARPAAYQTQPSFRTEQADFFFPVRSCEPVDWRREKSLFALALVGAAFLGGLLAQSIATPRFSALPQRPLRLRVTFFLYSPLATRHSPLRRPTETPAI